MDRYFTVSELWGPFPCENKGCDNSVAFTIKLTEEENKSLPEQHGPDAVRFIFKNKLGVAMCDECMETIESKKNEIARKHLDNIETAKKG